MMQLTTSVVLTTYNGKKYIESLVDSLRWQTREIDEVIICDDCSTDGTVLFLKKYIAEHHLDGWRILENAKNKGWKKNFRDAILTAKCDLVFPCDQDDVWELNKIEKMSNVFEQNQQVILLSSDYTPLYEEGGAKVDTFEYQSETPVFVKDDERFSIHIRPGCVMAVRKTFAEKLAGIWEDDYAHDAFLWTAATLVRGNYLLRMPLIKYRRHSNNASTGAHRTISNQVLLMNMGEKIVSWYKSNYQDTSVEKSHMLNGYIQWAKLRTELLLERKLINFFRLLKYHKYFRSLRQELGDLYYLVKSERNVNE